MKKYILFSLIMIIISTFVFSYSMNNGENKNEIRTFDARDLMKVEIKSYDNIIKNIKKSKLILSYHVTYKEVRIQFSCPYDQYDEGETIIAIRNVMLDFIEEKGFYHYSRLSDDIIKYKKDEDGIVFINYFAHFKIYK